METPGLAFEESAAGFFVGGFHGDQVPTVEIDEPKKKRFRPATEMVHGGAMRSQFAETSEALFLTQGFVYPDAEAAEARFKGEDPGFVYSRYANPTVAMFEERMCLLEGAEAALARRERHGRRQRLAALRS